MLDGLDFAHLPWQRVLTPAKNELQNQYISLESRDQQGLIRIIPSDANTLVDFTAAMLKAQAARGGILLENPEDLGRNRRGGGPT